MNGSRTSRLLWGFVVVQGIVLMLLAVLVYQTSSKEALGHQSFLRHFHPLLGIVRVLDRSLNVFYRGPEAPAPLPQYRLSIASSDLRAIEDAIPDGASLPDEARVWVEGFFTGDDGEVYDVDVRIRGDLFPHWRFRKKSWRVRFPKDKLFRGMREINLIIPEDRAWFVEPFNMYRAEKFGIIHPPMRFATLDLNASGPALYLEVEHWSKEMLEKLAQSGDSNLFQSGDTDASIFNSWDPVELDTAYWDKYEESAFTEFDSYEEIELFFSLSEAAQGLSNEQRSTIERFFDVEELLRFQALGILSGTQHGLGGGGNLRMLFDQSRGRFTLLPWDFEAEWPRSLTEQRGGTILRALFYDPEWRLALYQFLWDYVDDEETVEADLAKEEELRASMEAAAYRDSMKLMSNRQVKNDLDKRSAQIRSVLERVKADLKTAEVLVHYRVPSSQARDAGVVLGFDLVARGISPVELQDMAFESDVAARVADGRIRLFQDDGDDVFGDADFEVPLVVEQKKDDKDRTVVVVAEETIVSPIYENGNTDEAPHTRYRFFLTADPRFTLEKDDIELKLNLRNAITGKKANRIGEVVIDDRTFERAEDASISRDEFLRRYPMFARDGTDGVRLSGTHTLRETVIVPADTHLTVAPGAVIAMGSGVSLLSYSPVTVEGTERLPIRFRRADSGRPWGVFAVLNAEEKSTVSWVGFSGGGQAFLNGTFFSGMVAFHGSPVSVSDSTFKEASGDDGLNIKNVPADISRSEFKDNAFDGLDIDVAESGEVRESLFHGNGNDGIDISWSEITIETIESVDNSDKCLSAGERSELTVKESVFRGCAIGIAVKDGSRVTVDGGVFEGNDVAIAAYVKKPIFSSPSAIVRKSIFVENGKDTDAQNDAKILIE